MPYSDVEVLEKKYIIRDQLIDLIMICTVNPKPNYDIDGQKILWADYLKLLEAQLEAIENQIEKLLPPIEGVEQGFC